MFLAILVALGGGLGVTMGAHRLYSHKTFKAKPALRLALVLLQTMAGQVSGRPLYTDGWSAQRESYTNVGSMHSTESLG